VTGELLELRRDYLQSVHDTALRLRRRSLDLGSDQFKVEFPELLFAAHQLKGSGASLGFPRITELAERMRDELNHFIDPAEAARPSREQLSEMMIVLSHELEREATAAQKTLQV
jgi:HPt (histidine-containing phosphotransfer) domain-containing protein